MKETSWIRTAHLCKAQRALAAQTCANNIYHNYFIDPTRRPLLPYYLAIIYNFAPAFSNEANIVRFEIPECATGVGVCRRPSTAFLSPIER
jgi:hypothetical protein